MRRCGRNLYTSVRRGGRLFEGSYAAGPAGLSGMIDKPCGYLLIW